MQSLDEIRQQAEDAIKGAVDGKSLDACRVHFLGKKA